MKVFTKIAALVIAALMMAACLTGCSVKNSKLVVATNAAFEPFEYVEDDGSYAGFDIEMAQYIANKLGRELVIEDMEFNSVVTAVQSGKADIGIACITITDDRKKSVDFTTAYYSASQAIIVASGSDIASPDDLAGKTIGVQLGTTGDIFVSDYVDDATVAQYNAGIEAGMDLANGKIDAIVIDSDPAQKIAESLDLVVLDAPLTDEEIGMCIKKGNSVLLDDINNILKEMKADGTYDRLLQRYGLAASAD